MSKLQCKFKSHTWFNYRSNLYSGVGSPLIPNLEELVQHKPIIPYKATTEQVFFILSLPVLRYRYVAGCGGK